MVGSLVVQRYAIDEANSDRVMGWAFDGDRPAEVGVVVDGTIVGHAVLGGYRIDVARSLGDERASTSGFEFTFRPEHFRHVTGRSADVGLVIGQLSVPVVSIAVVREVAPDRELRGPFPPAVLRLLVSLSEDYSSCEWTNEDCMTAVDDLRFLVARGPQKTREVHRFLSLLAQLWVRASFVERHFPRENPSAAIDAKDRSGVQNSGLEVFSVAAHLATLRAHGVQGEFVEFGCFKGFSTAILSDACHQLGIRMHVFDSFEGLPPSKSTYYHSGDFAGSLSEVRENVASYGRESSVVFHPGFFADSLPSFDTDALMCIWMDVDLESSSRDAMAVLPRLDPQGVVFSHECSPEQFADGKIVATRTPESVVPPIMDAFAAAGRAIAGQHVFGHTGAFWAADHGIRPLPTAALDQLRNLSLECSLGDR